MSAVRVGLIGAGSMGALHARTLSNNPRTELSWVADPTAAAGRAIAERFATVHLPEPDLSSVDAVVIAAPTQHHHALAMEVLGQGLPLLLEKPLSHDLASAQAIVNESAARHVPLMCGFLERFNPALRTVVDILDRPLHLRITRHSPYVDRIRTGVASDLLIHDADIAIRLIGAEPVRTIGQTGHFHPKSASFSEDIAEAHLEFPDGQIASLSASRLSQRKIREVVIYELDRMIEVDLLRQDITIYRHVGDIAPLDDELGYRQQTIIDVPVLRYGGEPLALQLEHFLALLDGNVDADAERATLLPAHVVVAQTLPEGAP